MFGPSYLGHRAVGGCHDPPASLRALAAPISSARVRAFTYPGGTFSLDSTLAWLGILDGQRRHVANRARAISSARGGECGAPRRRSRSVTPTWPSPASTCRFYQDWLARQDDDAFWAPVEFDRHLAALTVPVTMVTGWYDIFLPAQLADYRALREAGHGTPGSRSGPGSTPTRASPARACAMRWRGSTPICWAVTTESHRARVRLFVGGDRRWVDVEEWPPPARSVRGTCNRTVCCIPRTVAGVATRSLSLRPGGPDAVGRRHASSARSGGRRDNRALERRADVLVYSSAPLVRDVEVMGPVTADLHVRSTLEHADFFVRLCDVEPSGKSWNICDGLIRLTPEPWQRRPDGTAHVEVSLWPAAHVFRRGHRIRAQVSSGAHPRFVRNLGGGDPIATAVAMHVADQEVWHDPDHPSAIVLPIRDPA